MKSYTRLIITYKDRDLVVMPLLLAVLLALVAPHAVGIAAIIALFKGCRVFTESVDIDGYDYSVEDYAEEKSATYNG